MNWLSRWSDRLPQRGGAAPSPAAPVAPIPAGTKMPPRRTWWTFIAIVLVNYWLVSWLLRADDPLMVPYTAFKAEVAKGNVASIYIQGAGIEGRFKTPVTWPPPLGGRAAEEVAYGTRTTGAESDIEQATGLARSMVTRWGMSDKLGMLQLAPRQNAYLGGGAGFGSERPFSDDTARVIDALVEALLARETLDEKEILAATGLPPAPALPGSPLAVVTEGGRPPGAVDTTTDARHHAPTDLAEPRPSHATSDCITHHHPP